MLPTDAALLAAFPSSPKTLHFKALITKLGVDKALRGELRARLRALCADGKLERVHGNEFARPASPDVLPGLLTVHPRGFAFVNLDSGGDGIYIDPRDLGDAMHRDRVHVRIRSQSKRGAEGVIEDVIERGTHTFVGTYRAGRRGFTVHPQDGRLPEHMPVEASSEARDGDRVAVRLKRYPGDPQGAMGTVIRVFGTDGEVAQETDVIVYDLGLRLQFGPGVEEAAEAAPATLSDAEIARRTDLRTRPLVTIDPESARDFDDALHARRLDEGGWRLTVAIADVSHYVRPGTALDDEAQARGTSIYLPDRVLPMLPERLSADLCSLRPGEDRPAMVVEFTVTPDGDLVQGAICEAVIRSHARFTYDRVARMLGLRGPDDQPQTDDDPAFEALRPELQALVDAMRARRRWRARRGYLNLEVGEAKVWFDDEGEVSDIRPGSRHEAHLTVEDAMLAANEIVADWFVDRDLPSIFRVHDQPNQEALIRFRDQALALEAPLTFKGKATPIALNRYLRAQAEHPLKGLLNMLLLRSMSKAVYDEEHGGHFGLGAVSYLHFTSPIRRYPDLVVHRLWKQAMAGDPVTDDESLDELAVHCSRRERAALEAERAVMDMYKARFLVNHVGEEYTGTVIGVVPLGAFVQLDEHIVEGLIHTDRLRDDDYRFDNETGELVGRKSKRRIGLGTRVKVRIAKVDVTQRRVELTLVKRLDLQRN